MLTPEQIADGWKPHDGGPCPVPLDRRVSVMFDDSIISTATAAFWANGHDWWQWEGAPEHRIIAYREEPSDAA